MTFPTPPFSFASCRAINQPGPPPAPAPPAGQLLLPKQLQQEFGERLDFVFRNFPLTEEHPLAQPAALAAEAAGLQGRFWPMHDLIYAHQEQLRPASFADFAQKLKLDPARFAADSPGPAVAAKVQRDFEGGVRSGVNGTPTFFLNGERLDSYDGTYESLQRAVAEYAPQRR